MKKGMKILAASMAAAMVISSVPVSAASRTSLYSSSYSFKSWWENIWNNVSNIGTKETEKETEETEGGLELTMVEDESTVENGEMLRASTYAAVEDRGVSAQADSTTTLKYFPVTMYNYDKTKINNATHQVEVDKGLGNTWNGIYFNDGNPSAESYNYTIGEVSYDSTKVNYSSNNNYNDYINNGYYVDVNGTKYLVIGLSCVRTGRWWPGYTYSWTITYNGGTATSSNSSITLYKAGGTTTRSLSYAAWNFWNKGTGNNDYGQYTYSGLVESTLTANKDITFTKPEGGIFNSDATVKKIYTNVDMPFVYENGTYTFDASQNGVYFNADSTQSSTAAQSNGRLYFNQGHPQSNGGNYGDGSTTVWMPFNRTRIIDGENNCDYHFGMRTTIPFTMTANGRVNPNNDESAPIKFSFSGDDDVWIFIDGQLVIDLGGIHNRLDATINFAENTWSISESNTSDVAVADCNNAAISGTIFNVGSTTGTLNQTRETFAAKDSHELTIFYLERGAGSSNCKIKFNLPMKDSVSVRKVADKSKTEKGIISDLTAEEKTMVANTDFGFTLYKDNKVVSNTNYSLLNANGQYVDTRSTDANGHFTLKAGQTAKFVGTIGDNTYYVVEDANANYQTPDYIYTAEASKGSNQTEDANQLTSMKVNVKGSDESADSLVFTCTNYLNADLPNPTSSPADDKIVIDYGLSVVIDVLSNDVHKGEYKLASGEEYALTGAPLYDDGGNIIGHNELKYGTAVANADGTITYTLDKQLTGVEVLTYYATASSGDLSDTNEGHVYIIPATSMYYEEDFEGLVTFSDGWIVEGTAQTDPQEPGVVGTVGDSPYGSDAAYLNDSGDSNGSSKYIDTTSSEASFSYTFTGTGTSFFARTGDTAAYMRVVVTGANGKTVSDTRRNNIYKEVDGTKVGTLYNVPVYTTAGLNYGTYTVTVTVMKANAAISRGKDFYLDGVRVINPLDSADANVSTAKAAYATDGEANMTVATLRQKLLGDSSINEDGTISWDGTNFVVFTDSNGEITTAEEYRSNGPKEEVYLNDGQSVSFSLTDWDANSNKIYLGVKAPLGSGSVSINGNTLQLNNAADCYYEISGYADITTDADGVKIATFKVESTSSLVSVTNIKVTGNAEFIIVDQKDEDVDVQEVKDDDNEENTVNVYTIAETEVPKTETGESETEVVDTENAEFSEISEEASTEESVEVLN